VVLQWGVVGARYIILAQSWTRATSPMRIVCSLPVRLRSRSRTARVIWPSVPPLALRSRGALGRIECLQEPSRRLRRCRDDLVLPRDSAGASRLVVAMRVGHLASAICCLPLRQAILTPGCQATLTLEPVLCVGRPLVRDGVAQSERQTHPHGAMRVRHTAACRRGRVSLISPGCGCCSRRYCSGRRRHVRRSEAALPVRPDRREDLNPWRRALRSGRCQLRKGPDVR
jgi:hypothetical protein